MEPWNILGGERWSGVRNARGRRGIRKDTVGGLRAVSVQRGKRECRWKYKENVGGEQIQCCIKINLEIGALASILDIPMNSLCDLGKSYKISKPWFLDFTKSDGG